MFEISFFVTCIGDNGISIKFRGDFDNNEIGDIDVNGCEFGIRLGDNGIRLGLLDNVGSVILISIFIKELYLEILSSGGLSVSL